MGTLLAQAASPDVLYAAWKRFRRDNAVWAPGVSKREMERNVGYHLMKLSEALRTNAYSPDRVRVFPVSKGDGGSRLISAVTLRDKVAQRAVLNVVEPLFEKTFHHDSFGYRPGRNVEMALAKVREYLRCGLGWVVDADIANCFDEIPHKPLLRAVRTQVPDTDVIALIRRWIDVGTVRRGFMAPARGVPQGSVLSPLLCNIHLSAWDYAMSDRNMPFVRFADDLLVFARSRADAGQAMAFAGKTLHRLGLRFHESKTRVGRAGPQIRFLGRRLPKLKPENKTGERNGMERKS